MLYCQATGINALTILSWLLLNFSIVKVLSNSPMSLWKGTPSLVKRESQNIIYNTGGDFKVYPTATEDCIKFDVPAGVQPKRDSTIEVLVTLAADVVCTNVEFPW